VCCESDTLMRGYQVKNLINMISFEFRKTAPFVYAICGGMTVVQIISFLFTRTKIEFYYCYFEKLLELSGYPFVFFVAFFAVLILNGFSFYQNFIGSKSIYTLMSLPSNRNNIYISKVVSGLVAVLFLMVVQIASVFLTYRIYLVGQSHLPISNGLFMAFIRTKFLRAIMPFDFISFLLMFICVASFVVAILYVFVCIKSSKYINMTVGLMIVFWSTQSLYNNHMELFDNLFYLIVILGLLLLTLTHMIFYSLEAVKKARIL